MPAIYLPRQKRVFIQQQSTLRTVPNSSGTWTNTGAKLLRVPENGFSTTPVEPKTPIPWLTGTRSRQPTILGRRSTTASINNLQMIPSGAAGTPPDSDSLWQSIFGQAGVVVAATSVTYSFLDTGLIPLTLFMFPHGSTTLTSQYVWGLVPTEVTLNFNGNIFDANVTLSGGYTVDNNVFGQGSMDTVAKAGLSTYPLEPSSPTVNGTVMPGFGGDFTLGTGNALVTKIQSFGIRIQTGYRLIGDLYDDAYPAIMTAGERTISLTNLSFVDDDSAVAIAVKQAAQANTALDVTTINLGTVAGNKWRFLLKGVQLPREAYRDENDEVRAEFPEAIASASAIGSVDEFSMVCL